MSNVGATVKKERLRVTVDPATIRPLGSMVLLEMMPEGRTEGGLVVPDSVKLRARAKVHGIGPGSPRSDLSTNEGRPKAGDFVILAPGTPGKPVGRMANGNELALVNEEHLLAIDTADWDAVVRMESLQ